MRMVPDAGARVALGLAGVRWPSAALLDPAYRGHAGLGQRRAVIDPP